MKDPPKPDQSLTTRARPETQFHHYISRLVLRRFAISQVKKLYPKARHKEELIYCYKVSESTSTIATRPLSKTYGVRNLYKDTANLENAYEIELKLGKLEAWAGKVISTLLTAIGTKANDGQPRTADGPEGTSSFKMKRKDHNAIRKFMHVMYYRKHSFAKTYWKEDDPENTPIRNWISKYSERENIERDAVALWLHVLRYYLDTPHPDIIDHGRKAKGEHMRQSSESPYRYTPIDPNLEHLEAFMYSQAADGFYLAIWEAAPGEEFILSENSFGLFEGRDSSDPIHGFYVISPKVALVLCSVSLQRDFNNKDPRLRELSMLWDVNHKPPKVIYAETPPEFKDDRERSEFEAQENHRVDDTMEFEVLTLSIKHTHIVNAIILGNVKENGLVTFQSKEAILRTLDSFGENDDFENHAKYAPLVRGLLEDTGGSVTFKTLRYDSDEDFGSKYKRFQAMGQENPEKHDSLEVSKRFHKELARRVADAHGDPSKIFGRINVSFGEPSRTQHDAEQYSFNPPSSDWQFSPSPPPSPRTQPLTANSNPETVGNYSLGEGGNNLDSILEYTTTTRPKTQPPFTDLAVRVLLFLLAHIFFLFVRDFLGMVWVWGDH